ncbi:uncharacterized protein VTP21DRAFT_1407 [Calcarisporiella thermophila]|uniref:uncharacterized protein n=1 Tax=Calcarisporiella thermophila TaxID=911321 RepID=UPI0037445732
MSIQVLNATLTPEQPFGVSLDNYFAQAYHSVMGKSADEFAFIQGETPLSTNTEVFTACILYLVIIFGGQYLMRNREPFQLRGLFQAHNFILSVGSLGLLLLFFEQLFPIVYRQGFLYAVCNQSAFTQRLELLYYINYLYKYYELIDTLFLVLKKKKLDFLHYYHHSMTAVLCYTQLVGRTSVSWVPITLNLLVHVLMYYYYMRASMGHRIWWKRYLTTMQITQFVIDLFVIYFCSYTYFAHAHFPFLPNMGFCSGTVGAALFGCYLLTSYLVLFINFYIQTYKKNAAKAKKLKDL